MKIGYFGSPLISSQLLEYILNEGEHTIEFVVSNPDRPKGRSGHTQPCEVAALALKKSIPLYRFDSLKEDHAKETLKSHNADIFFVFAYGKILPSAIYELPHLGTLNLHASLLPLLRGASPIQSSILQGLDETGWTLQKVGRELDAGDILANVKLRIDAEDTTRSLSEKLMQIAGPFAIDSLRQADALLKKAVPQDHRAATYCKKITPDTAQIEWDDSAQNIHQKVCGLYPSPSAYTYLHGKRIKIIKTAPPKKISHADQESYQKLLRETAASPAGTIYSGALYKKRLIVKTGEGTLEILELQPENRKVMKGSDFFNGYRIRSGDSFTKVPNP